MEVVLVPAFKDNYVFLAHSAATGETMVVDPGEAGPALAEADRRGWRITHILNTHWHADHIGGNAEVKAATGAILIGPSESGRIPNLDRTVADGDIVPFGDTQGQVIAVPGHTAGHIAFHFDDPGIAFVGDTMFALGCGRLLEGTAEQMHASLARLMALPDPTFVYCAHEYTESNLRFAESLGTPSPALAQRAEIVRLARAAAQPTVPSSIGLERATNPFVRAETVARFAELRAAKDAFKG